MDLSAVARAAIAEGFELIGATHQAQLLERLGLVALRRRIDLEIPGRVERRAHHAALDLLCDGRQLGAGVGAATREGRAFGAANGLRRRTDFLLRRGATARSFRGWMT